MNSETKDANTIPAAFCFGYLTRTDRDQDIADVYTVRDYHVFNLLKAIKLQLSLQPIN